MQRFVPTVAAALLTGLALAGCSSATLDATPDASPGAGTASSAAVPTSVAAQPSASPSAAIGAGRPRSATGSIVFHGALSGTMTVSSCQNGMASLVVEVPGAPSTYAGLIDADDFTFAIPHQGGFTLAPDAPKPRVSGSTYTVRKTTLVGLMDDDTVVADGSVTCP